MAGYPMNPMMAGAYMGGGQGGAMNPMAMMGYMDPNLMGAQREIDFGQGLMGEGTSTAPAYPMQALARALQGVVGGYMTHRGMAKFGDAFSEQGNGGDLAGQAAAALGPNHPLVKGLGSSSALIRAYALSKLPEAMVEAGKPYNLGANEQRYAGGGNTPVATNTMPLTEIPKMLHDLRGMAPNDPGRPAVIAGIQKVLTDSGYHIGPDGSMTPVAGGPADPAQVGALAGAKDWAGVGPHNAEAAFSGNVASAVANNAPANLGPTDQRVINPPLNLGGAAPGGPAGAPPGAAAQPAVTSAVAAPQGFYGDSAGAPALDTGTAPAPAPQAAGGDTGRMAGTPAPTTAGQPPMPPKPEAPIGTGITETDQPGGGKVISSNVGLPKIAEDRYTKYQEVSGAAATARDEIQKAQLIRQKIQQLNTGGPANEYFAGLSALAQELGVPKETLAQFNIPDGATSEQVDKLSMDLLGSVLKAQFPQRITNADITAFRNTVPNTRLRPESSMYLLDNTILPRAQRDIERFGSIVSLPDQDPRLNGMEKALYDFDNKHPLSSFTPSLKEKPAEQPPMPGARKAADGNWYLPDQARPGKYLMVKP